MTPSIIELLQKDKLTATELQCLENGLAKAFEDHEANKVSVNHEKIINKIEEQISRSIKSD